MSTEPVVSHVEQLRSRIGGYTEKELEQARRADQSAEDRRQAAARAQAIKDGEEKAKRRAAQHAADAKTREARVKRLLAQKCSADLGGCTGKSERFILPSGTVDPLHVPAFAIHVICLNCARALNRA